MTSISGPISVYMLQTQQQANNIKQQKEYSAEMADVTEPVTESFPSSEQVKEYVDKINQLPNISVRIEIDEDLNKPIIKLVDTETDHIVRQIPPEDILSTIKKLREYSEIMETAGMIFDEKV